MSDEAMGMTETNTRNLLYFITDFINMTNEFDLGLMRCTLGVSYIIYETFPDYNKNKFRQMDWGIY